MTRVVEINEIEQLAAYRDDWGRQLQVTRGGSFFRSLEWLECYWRHFGRGQRLRVLMVYERDALLGILPLVERDEQTRAGAVRVLTYPLHDWGSFYGPIGPHPALTLGVGLRHIASTPADWQLCDLRWIDTERADFGRTANAMRLAGLPGRRGLWAQTAVIGLDSDWPAYWASRKPKFRENARRAERVLAQRGRLELLRYRPAGRAAGEHDPRWDLYNACEAIAGQSWQANSNNGTTLTHPEVRDFFRDTHAAAAAAGALDLCLLYVGGAPVAFLYNYHTSGEVQGLRRGFDPSCSAGAGTVLLARAIEDSFARGDRMFDLGTMYLDSKRQWLTGLLPCGRVTYYRPLPRAQLLRAKHTMAAWWRGSAAEFSRVS